MKRVKDLESIPEWEYGIDDSDRFWACVEGSREVARLEDIIRIASSGIRVSCFMELKKKNVEIKVKNADADRHQSRIDAFLLLAEYAFSFEETTARICKVYVFGKAQRSGKIQKVDRDVANQRLRVDYERLRAANIEFKELFFEDNK